MYRVNGLILNSGQFHQKDMVNIKLRYTTSLSHKFC